MTPPWCTRGVRGLMVGHQLYGRVSVRRGAEGTDKDLEIVTHAQSIDGFYD